MSYPILLVEAGGGGNLPAVLLVLALAGFVLAYLVIGRGRRRGPRRNADIPLAMRPYHSDEELETTGMERAMSWAVVFAVFAGLFLAMYWLIEPTRIADKNEEFYEQDVAAGRATFQDACAQCHGEDLGGGSAAHPDADIDAPWPAPALNNIVARYEESEIVDDVEEHIMLTLTHGRPGTPMPAFSTMSGGQYSDNQLEQIIAYILSVQTGEPSEVDAQAFEGRSGEDVFGDNCARCHGEEAQGRVGPQLINVFERYGWDGESEESLEQAREVVRDTIMDGRYVPGKAPMPSFDQTLTDDAVTAVIDHLESLQETGGPRFGQLGGDEFGQSAVGESDAGNGDDEEDDS